MKLFNNKIIQKIIIAIFLIILLFEFTIPSISNADASAAGNAIGGVLFEPIRTLLLLIGDVASTGLNLFVWRLPFSVLYLETDASLEMDNWSDTNRTVWKMLINVLDPTGILNNTRKVVLGAAKETDFIEEIQLPVFLVTPEAIFSNKVPLLDINFINPTNYYDTEDSSNPELNQYLEAYEDIMDGGESSAAVLQPIISSWYVALRTIATVGFMLVLVYIGIRIIISSTAADTSKYKQMLKDWVIGLCLLYTMHYIMAGAIYVTEKITDLFNNDVVNVVIEYNNVDLNNYPGVDARYSLNRDIRDIFVSLLNNNPAGDTQLLSWNTDLTGYTRFMAQVNIGSNSITTMIIYTLMYIVLVIYTYIFLFKYLKRLLNMVLLTLIAPVVSFTYPLDKLSDGSAQAFNIWLKEYIYNLLIQPVHLILYTVFIGSAQSLAVDHPIYAIAALGFLLQAEKFIRKLFRFDNKASITGAAATGAFTGAAVMKGIESAVKLASKKGGTPQKGGKPEGGSNNIRTDKNIERKADDKEETKKLVDSAISLEDQDENVNNRDLPKNSNPSIGDENVSGENPVIPVVEETETGENPVPTVVGERGTGENPNPEQKPKDTKPKKVKKPNFAKAAGKYYGKKIGKGVGKFALKALTAGTLGTIGVAAGLASDDASKVFTYGAAGIAGGALIGNSTLNLPSQISNAVRADREEIIKQQYADDPAGYRKILNERADNQWKNNEEVKQKYIEEFGKEKYKKMMDLAMKYRKHGITDDELIIRAMNQNNSFLGEDKASDKRIAMAKLASKVSNSKDIESIEKDLNRKLSKQVDIKNLDEAKKEEIRNEVDDRIDAIKGISGFKFL